MDEERDFDSYVEAALDAYMQGLVAIEDVQKHAEQLAGRKYAGDNRQAVRAAFARRAETLRNDHKLIVRSVQERRDEVENSFEQKVRLRARKLGWRIEKSRSQELGNHNYGLLRVMNGDTIVGGEKYNLDIEDVQVLVAQEEHRRK